MKRFLLVFPALVVLLALCGAVLAEDGDVKLAIKGTNVNLRPQPKAGGSVVAQMNTGDVFFAEKWPIEYDDKSQWYVIILPAPDSGAIKPLSDWDKRFVANFAFVNANFAAVSPLKDGDMERISAALPKKKAVSADNVGADRESVKWSDFISLGVDFIGSDIAEIAHKWSGLKIERSTTWNYNDDVLIATNLKAADMEACFSLNLTYAKDFSIGDFKALRIERKGTAIGGIQIGVEGFGKEQVETRLGQPNEISEYADIVEWGWGDEDGLDSLSIYFNAADGLVNSIYIFSRGPDDY